MSPCFSNSFSGLFGLLSSPAAHRVRGPPSATQDKAIFVVAGAARSHAAVAVDEFRNRFGGSAAPAIAAAVLAPAPISWRCGRQRCARQGCRPAVVLRPERRRRESVVESVVNALSSFGRRNLSLFDPESAYRMMTNINNAT